MAGDRELAILNPERNLWQEVLLHTIRDARLKPLRRLLGENAQSEALDARRYLTTPSDDLAMVCMFAGVDMEALVDRMRVQVAKAPRVGVLEVGSSRSKYSPQSH